MREDFSQYLKELDRLGEPGLAFAPKIDVEAVRAAMEAVFGSRHVFTLRANGPLELKPEEVDESVRNSFEGKGVLAVVVGPKVSTHLLKVLEQICEDEGLYHQQPDNSWIRRKPPEGWRLLVLAEVADLASVPEPLALLFAAPFALG